MNPHFCANHNCVNTSAPLRPQICPQMDFYYNPFYNHYCCPPFTQLRHNMNASNGRNGCAPNHQNYCHQSCCHNQNQQHFGRNSSRNEFNPSICSATASQPIITEVSNDGINNNTNESEVGEDINTFNNSSDETIDGSERDEKKSTLSEVMSNFNEITTQLKEMLTINANLKQNLVQTNDKLREKQISMIELSQKYALDSIEKYKNDLKIYSDYIAIELKRFEQNEVMSQKLRAIVEQISDAKNRVKEEEERLEAYKALQNTNELDENDVFFFDGKRLPQLPDLLQFSNSFIEEIPVEFLSDVNLMKNSAKELNEHKTSADFSQMFNNDMIIGQSVKLELNIGIEETLEAVQPLNQMNETVSPKLTPLPKSLDNWAKSETILEKAPEMTKLSSSQTRILDKLRKEYNHLSDKELIESMFKTRELEISSGNVKGFNGLAISEIVERIGVYIKKDKFRPPMVPKGWKKL